MSSEVGEETSVEISEVFDLGYDPNLTGKHRVVVCDVEDENSDDGRLSYPVIVELESGIQIRGRAWPGDSIENLLWAVGVDPLKVGRRIPKDQIRGKKVEVSLDRVSVGDAGRPRWVFKGFNPLP